MGTWILGRGPDAPAVGAAVGYLWRYLGDGGGIGVAFFVMMAATGWRRIGPRRLVAAAMGFAVFPVRAGLIATVGLWRWPSLLDRLALGGGRSVSRSRR